jgi:phosphotransferase system HPr (HPr) family protein
MKQATFTIKHGVGLHARPAAKFVKLVKEFSATVTIRNISRDGETVDAKSLVKVIKIAAAQHQEVEVTADGEDEDAAMAAITTYLTDVPTEEQ